MELDDLLKETKPAKPVYTASPRQLALVTKLAREGRLEWKHREAQKLARVLSVSTSDLAIACGLVSGFGLDNKRYAAMVRKGSWQGPVAMCLSYIRDSVTSSKTAPDVQSLGVKTSILSLTHD